MVSVTHSRVRDGLPPATTVAYIDQALEFDRMSVCYIPVNGAIPKQN